MPYRDDDGHISYKEARDLARQAYVNEDMVPLYPQGDGKVAPIRYGNFKNAKYIPEMSNSENTFHYDKKHNQILWGLRGTVPYDVVEAPLHRYDKDGKFERKMDLKNQLKLVSYMMTPLAIMHLKTGVPSTDLITDLDILYDSFKRAMKKDGERLPVVGKWLKWIREGTDKKQKKDMEYWRLKFGIKENKPGIDPTSYREDDALLKPVIDTGFVGRHKITNAMYHHLRNTYPDATIHLSGHSLGGKLVKFLLATNPHDKKLRGTGFNAAYDGYYQEAMDKRGGKGDKRYRGYRLSGDDIGDLVSKYGDGEYSDTPKFHYTEKELEEKAEKKALKTKKVKRRKPKS